MLSVKTIKIITSIGLLWFYSSVLLSGDIGVDGSVTATTFVGDGTGLTGVVNAPASLEPGDMLHWNGVAWVLIPAPDMDANRLSFCSGTPMWTTAGCIYAIGDTGPAGGVVFHITHGGLHGLEASLADQSSNVAWGCAGTFIQNANGTAVGTGAENTRSILAGCAYATIAASSASHYSLNGFDDWFLPSKDELNLLYQQKVMVGGFANDFYWSSTQNTNIIAFYQHLDSGIQGGASKGNWLRVRAVRAF